MIQLYIDFYIRTDVASCVHTQMQELWLPETGSCNDELNISWCMAAAFQRVSNSKDLRKRRAYHYSNQHLPIINQTKVGVRNTIDNAFIVCNTNTK